MRADQGERRPYALRLVVVVIPAVGAAESRVLVVIVNPAMQGVGAALGQDLNLAARAPAEVGSLVSRGNLEFLNAGDRDRNNCGGRLVVAGTVLGACSSGGVRTKALN